MLLFKFNYIKITLNKEKQMNNYKFYTDIVQAFNDKLEANKECYVAQWVLQNPKEDIFKYTLVEKRIFEGTSLYQQEFSLVKKECFTRSEARNKNMRELIEDLKKAIEYEQDTTTLFDEHGITVEYFRGNKLIMIPV